MKILLDLHCKKRKGGESVENNPLVIKASDKYSGVVKNFASILVEEKGCFQVNGVTGLWIREGEVGNFNS